jgi:uncharacterized protein
MSLTTLEAAWRFLFPDGQIHKGFSIRLGSGEPLLAFSLLRHLGERIEREKGAAAENRPAVFITTNGTLADEGVRDWLAASGWHVKFSLDGPLHVHDRWRVAPDGRGTYAPVADAVADLAQRLGDRFSVTAVLCRGADPGEVFEAIAALGVRRIEMVPVAHEREAVRPGPEDVARYERFVTGYARRYLDAASPLDIPILVRFETRVVRLIGYNLRTVPCGAGRSFLGVGPDGDLYPCFRFVGLEPYRLGSLSSGLDLAAATAFQHGPGRPYDHREACRACWAAPLCGGPCFACTEMFGPGDGQPLDLHCAYVLADARAAVSMVGVLRAQAPERLLAFLPQVPELAGLL